MSEMFPYIPLNSREKKPRKIGLTEIRGPYYSVVGKRYLQDLFDTMGSYIDGLKFGGGSFSLMPKKEVIEIIELAHEHNVYVSTGGWLERVLCYGPDCVNLYLQDIKNMGFDVVEISTGFISLSTESLLRLIEQVTKLGLKAKPELGIQFGTGGGSPFKDDPKDINWLIHQAKQCLAAGAYSIMIESEGITENVDPWKIEVPSKIISSLGLENVMFEAAEPKVFEWYIKNYGLEANLFIDHSQIIQLEALRSGVWGTKDTWGRIVKY